MSAKIQPDLKAMLKQMNDTKDRLLKITFTTLSEYLFILRELTTILKQFKSNTMLYLAAAVSDFYIPSQNMVFCQKKIQFVLIKTFFFLKFQVGS